MNKNDNFFNITKPEIRFWMYIILTIIPVVIYIVGLNAKVNAMEDKGIVLRSDFERSVEQINKKLEVMLVCSAETEKNIVAIQKDIQYIKKRLEE